jgi:stage II sporulation protein D
LSGRAFLGLLASATLALLVSACAGTAPQVSAPAPVVTSAVSTPSVAGLTPVVPIEPPARAIVVPAQADLSPPLIRVLVQAAGETILPEPGRRYACEVDGGSAVVLRGPLGARATPGRPVVQVGAFAKDENAAALVARLSGAGFQVQTGATNLGIHRVLAVAREGESALELSRRLVAEGIPEQKVVGAVGSRVEISGEGGAVAAGERIRLVPLDDVPVRVGSKTVRGELELRGGAGGVAVINVLSLEAYLRGVVPAEMGPRAFPAIEALKAQAVAARTYAVAHLGEYSESGYDICDTMQCQVYEGVGSEHPLSDRAVHETEGEIAVFAGQPIDAMYHSTCGGHTEDAAAVFPERAAPYLVGVVCRETRQLEVGRGDSVGPWGGQLERLDAIARALAQTVGAPASPRALASKLGGRPAGAGVVGLARAFAVEELNPLVRTTAVAREDDVFTLLRVFKLTLPGHAGRPSERWERGLVVRLAQLVGEVQTFSGRLTPGSAGLVVMSENGEQTRSVPAGLVVLERRGEQWREGRTIVSAGSPATLWCLADRCSALEVEALDEADGGSAWSSWQRELTCEEVANRLGTPAVARLEVSKRGLSGRALKVLVSTAAGTRELDGMAVRRGLGLPDTLFVVVAGTRNGKPVLRFLGRGWGHGVGMCQNGAYGMARGGASYREILTTYYHGIEIVKTNGSGGNHDEHSIRK